MGDTAQIGDKVRFIFAGGRGLTGMLKHMDCGPTQEWVVLSEEGQVVHVRNFETATVILMAGDQAPVAVKPAADQPKPGRLYDLSGRRKMVPAQS